MFKNLYKKLIGTYETVTIEKVEVLGERAEFDILKSPLIFQYPHPIGALFLIEMREVKHRYSGPKLKMVDVEAKRGNGSITSRTYEIPAYCAHGLIEKMKKSEGRKVQLRMRDRLPKTLPYIL